MTPEQEQAINDRITGRVLAGEVVDLIKDAAKDLNDTARESFGRTISEAFSAIHPQPKPKVCTLPAMTDMEAQRFEATPVPPIYLTLGSHIRDFSFHVLDQLAEVKPWFHELNRYLRSDRIIKEREQGDHGMS